MKVYLSGGMKADWRELVKNACPGIVFLDPVCHGLNDPDDYTLWDTMAVYRSDLVLAYMASDNPSGFGMAYEVGLAVARDIPVIMVDEKNDPRMAIIRSAATRLFYSLEETYTFLMAMAMMAP